MNESQHSQTQTKSNASNDASAEPRRINLALQGGGAHGAFTWGVLDTLLDDERIEIEGISGTSAGAMNAVVLADGMMRSGRDGARTALADFWRSVSDSARFSPVQRTLFDRLSGRWSMQYSPGYLMADLANRMFSPYQLNPLNLNPLRDFLQAHVDFDRVRHCDCLKLFISATRVRNGRVKIFDHSELCADAVMASACLPYVFQSVVLDGEAYWDGGYAGNPALFVFNRRTECRDVVLVEINPFQYDGVPKTAYAIQNRINEITFNSSLMKEFRAISFVTKLIDRGLINDPGYRELFIHCIEAQAELRPSEASSKVNAEWAFLRHLFRIGRGAAAEWLEQNFKSLGRASTMDIRGEFL